MENKKEVSEVEMFKEKVAVIESLPSYRRPIMFGLCKNTESSDGKTLESKYMHINVNENFGSAAILIMVAESICSDNPDMVKHNSDSETVYDVNKEFVDRALNEFNDYINEAMEDSEKHLNIQALLAIYNAMEAFDNLQPDQKAMIGDQIYRFTVVYEDKPVETVEAAYIKLTALSECKAGIRTLNLDGIFGVLTNCAWTVHGAPVTLEDLRKHKMSLIASGEYPAITHVDKFPRMLQHVLPADNTRILDTSKVRMGAHLAAGTTVMPGASYINFNAGTEGPVMVEGRISSSAIVGANSDVGGGASILGVLSGTDGNPITVGENCLLGSNSVCGIPLGDGCIIDAGVSILEGTKVYMDHMTRAMLNDVNVDNTENNGDNFASHVIKNGTPVVGDDAGVIINAKHLASFNGMHFRQNSLTGVITLLKSTREVKLKSELH